MRALFLTLINLIILSFIACEEPRPCSSDDDCREGFRCDLKVYVGECVEVVAVVRCGDQLCAAPEVCVRGEVCAIPEGGGEGGPVAGFNGGANSGVEVSGTESQVQGSQVRRSQVRRSRVAIIPMQVCQM